jgi:DNA-binding CsgD family transcriptional regulator
LASGNAPRPSPVDKTSAGFALPHLSLLATESEVLHWISHGKTNPEIGIIIGAASGTVKKHAENIFAKLQAEGRSAAMLRALEVLNAR